MTRTTFLALLMLSACRNALAVEVKVAPAELVEVKGEKLQLSAAPPQSWSQGTKLKQLQHLGPGQGVPANGALDAGSVVVRCGDRVLLRGKDYLLDPVWGSLGIGPNSSVTTEDLLTVGYLGTTNPITELDGNTSGSPGTYSNSNSYPFTNW